jgi:hypothetical protein
MIDGRWKMLVALIGLEGLEDVKSVFGKHQLVDHASDFRRFTYTCCLCTRAVCTQKNLLGGYQDIWGPDYHKGVFWFVWHGDKSPIRWLDDTKDSADAKF